MSKLIVTNHPMIVHKLTIMRKKETSCKDFRELLDEISMLMAYEVTRDLPLEDVAIETPMGEATCQMIKGKNLVIVPILRAGLGMVSGLHRMVPAAKVGHVGLYRDHDTHLPVEYYFKMPKDMDGRDIIVVDPMLATGGSASDAISMIKREGGKNIKFMSLIAAPEGIEVLQKAHPDVDIYTAAVDERLDENAYIIPGLGDAGDRLYGTL